MTEPKRGPIEASKSLTLKDVTETEESTFNSFKFSINKDIDKELVPENANIPEPKKEDEDDIVRGSKRAPLVPRTLSPTISMDDQAQEFSMDDVPAYPVLRVKLGPNESYVYEIQKKLLIGSDTEKCQVIIEHEEVPPIYCALGVKDGKVLLKHPGPHTIKLHGQEMLAGKSYIIPFGEIIKIGPLYAEVLKNRPLDLDARKPKTKLVVPGYKKNAAEEPVGDIGPQGLITHVLTFLFDPFGYINKREGWAKQVQLKQKQEYKSKMKEIAIDVKDEVYAPSPVTDAPEKHPGIWGSLIQALKSFKQEFTPFKSKKEQEVEKEATKIQQVQIQHLCQVPGITMEMAQKLVDNEITSVQKLVELKKNELNKILGTDQKTAEELKNVAKEKLAKKEITPESNHAKKLEKALEKVHDNIAPEVALELPRAGVFKRFLAFWANVGLTLHLCSLPDIELLARKAGILLTAKIVPNWDLSVLEDLGLPVGQVLTPIILFVALEGITTLIFSVNFGQWLVGLTSSGSFFEKRIKGLIRATLGLFTGPFLIFDVSAIWKMRTLKEFLSGAPLYRKSRPGGLEMFAFLIAVGFSISGFWTLKASISIAKIADPKIMERVEEMKKIIVQKEQMPTRQVVSAVRPKSGMVGNIIDLKGNASGTSWGKVDSVILKVGDQIDNGALVETPIGSETHVRQIGGNVVQVLSGSRVAFLELVDKEIGIIFVEKGCARFMPSDVNSESRLFVTTSNSQIFSEGAEGIVCFNYSNDITMAAALQGHLFTRQAIHVLGEKIRTLTQIDFEKLVQTRPLMAGQMHTYIRRFPGAIGQVTLDPAQVKELIRGPVIVNRAPSAIGPVPELGLYSELTQVTSGGKLDLENQFYLPPETPSWFAFLANRRQREDSGIAAPNWQDDLFLSSLQAIGRMERRARLD